jgi:hypothetical protein
MPGSTVVQSAIAQAADVAGGARDLSRRFKGALHFGIKRVRLLCRHKPLAVHFEHLEPSLLLEPRQGFANPGWVSSSASAALVVVPCIMIAAKTSISRGLKSSSSI